MSADDAHVAPRVSEDRPGGRLLSHLGKAVEVITSGGASPSRRRASSDGSSGGAAPSTSVGSRTKRGHLQVPHGNPDAMLNRLEEIPSPTRSMSRSVSFKLTVATATGSEASASVSQGMGAAAKLDEHARRIQRLWRKKSKSKSLSPSSMAKAERSECEPERVQRASVRRPSIREFVFRSAKQIQAATKIQSAWRLKSRSRGSLSSAERSTQSHADLAQASTSVSPFFPGDDSVDTLTWGLPSLTPRRRRSWAAWSERPLLGSAANSRTTSPEKHAHGEAAHNNTTTSRIGGTAAAQTTTITTTAATTHAAAAHAAGGAGTEVSVLGASAAAGAGAGAGGFWTDAQNWWGTTFGTASPGQPGLLETWWKDRKRRAIKSLLHNSAPILKRTLGDIGDLLKENTTADPDMPDWLRPVLRNLVGSFWEDVETEVETGLKMFVVKPPEEPQDLRVTHDPTFAKSCLRRWGLRFRAFVLTHYLPHDRSIWGRLKDPWYLLMTATTMLPIFGCRVFFFGMILFFLLFPGPPDEYQLINFILIFKGTQFFTTGVILGYFGAMQYYMCYLFADNVRLCINEHGPGISDYLASLLFDTFGSVILVWIAFLALPKTKTHWHNKVCLHGEAPVEREEVYCWCLTGVVRKGGRIRFLMRWDLCCFVACWVTLAPFYFASSYHIMSEVPHHTKIVHAKQTIFWCRILYSLLSLPFVIFVIPGLGRVLTHSLITGFDSTGACREFAFPEPAHKDEV